MPAYVLGVLFLNNAFYNAKIPGGGSCPSVMPSGVGAVGGMIKNGRAVLYAAEQVRGSVASR